MRHGNHCAANCDTTIHMLFYGRGKSVDVIQKEMKNKAKVGHLHSAYIQLRNEGKQLARVLLTRESIEECEAQ
jgi:hypothetical protein